ncbi:MAG: TRAP transporter small permease [Rhodospirillales bacterium]|nr:TRAP transporter small permease [Rhodospirillales bacterium]
MEWVLGGCCALLLAGLTAVTVVDVIGRYWFDSPLIGAFELTQLMLCGLIFSALPLTTRAGEHIEVDLLFGNLPRPLQSLFRVLSRLISAVVLAVIAWRLMQQAIRLDRDGAVTNALSLSLAPLAWFAALLAALSAILALTRMKARS